MIRLADGLPEDLALPAALCSTDLPFLIQLLHVLKRGDDSMILAALYLCMSV